MKRYIVLGQAGDGSFGTVSKAKQLETGEIVAAKKMKQRFQTWEECLQLREVQALCKLKHPNIVKLKEVVRENMELFLIFEYCERNIFQIQRRRMEEMSGVQTFNDREIRSVICQTLLGIQAFHKAGFMHRDIKPENLLVQGDQIKVADFGLAKEIRSRSPFTEYVSTRWYRAPEIVLHSSHYNSPIDIWACGVTFAELYLGRPLFPGTSESDQLFKICSVLGSPTQTEWDEGYHLARRLNMRFPTIAPTPLRQILNYAPSSAVDLIEKMLRFNPSDRLTATQCLQHPFFTGNDSNSDLFCGVSTGKAHNPFEYANMLTSPSSKTSFKENSIRKQSVCTTSPTNHQLSHGLKCTGLFTEENSTLLVSGSSNLPVDIPLVTKPNAPKSLPKSLNHKKDISDNVDDEFNF
ncbi:unnamed protein product [Phytomonas sp. Hart1]|nr:unnamed protein product [Phytomonas sp. Hart1]|eukprot:CCW71515.1 unnamed protein product [Phytomonas sp. isolate Hart1]